MKNVILFLLALGMISCQSENDASLAWGTFEATEILVSAEQSGQLISLDVTEGEMLQQNQQVGQIDTMMLYLQLRQLEANRFAILSGKPNISTQIAATKKEIAKWEQEKKRIEKLLSGDVATQKQLDDINAQLAILQSRLSAQRSSLSTNSSSLDAQAGVIDAQIDLIKEQLARTLITAPINGTVLVKYAEPSEMAAAGKPLFKMANLDQMILYAYVTSDQLPKLKLNQSVNTWAEFGSESKQEFVGKVIWISEKAEFTPKTIQTQDERANLVYAIKIAVPNDGTIKMGMYGGINLDQ